MEEIEIRTKTDAKTKTETETKAKITYLVKLTPQEPYFFGNEKRFIFAKEDNQGQMGNSYFIKSEKTPLQTTLLGMMRYILAPMKGTDNIGEPDNNEVIGEESFNIEYLKQEFGVIEDLSPLFLMKGEDKYVVTPFDCVDDKKKNYSTFFDETEEDEDKRNKKIYFYTPFKKYRKIETDSGEKWYAAEFDVKEDIENSYVRLSDKKIVKADDIFGTDVRVGNKKKTSGKAKQKDSGFFKKEYCYLKDGFIFAFYVTLNAEKLNKEKEKLNKETSNEKKGTSLDIPKSSEKTQVFLGQGKSLFTVEFTEAENTLSQEVAKILPENICYCLSDVYTTSEIYNSCLFSITQTKDYRSYITKAKGKIEKGSVLYKLIKAGSVFIVSDKEKFNKQINQDKAHCQKIGWNILIQNENQEGKS